MDKICKNGVFRSKLEIREQIEKEIVENWLFATQELIPLTHEDREYPDKISTGVKEILKMDKDFMEELVDIYERFMSNDWGDYYNMYEQVVISRHPEYAKGIYKTSWGDIKIARNKTYTTAFFPVED